MKNIYITDEMNKDEMKEVERFYHEAEARYSASDLEEDLDEVMFWYEILKEQ